MNRKNFIRTTGISLAALLTADNLFAGDPNKPLINFPGEATATLNNQFVKLVSKGKQVWYYKDLRVELKKKDDNIVVEIQSPESEISEVTLHWKRTGNSFSNVMNDAWERTYGDASWHKLSASEILPWYFLEFNGNKTNGFGVKTGASSFCSWQINQEALSLTMDTRNGGNGVFLGDRKLIAAEIITIKSLPTESSFKTLQRFTKKMCDKPRMPAKPVYGINDWYFTYGNNSEKLIIQLTEMMAPMADGLENRPFSVIDAGWFIAAPSSPNDTSGWGDRMDQPNAKFGDMSRVAEKIKKTGMRPGIWTRPLCGSYKDPKSLMLPLINGREENNPILDPSILENLERIKNYFKLYNTWGYELVKFDYTSDDIFGKWGFQMLKDKSMSTPGWQMHDNTKTNAEIVLNLYKTIREAAGETYVIGCNTFSHLSAGLFELNRIGDDTSGNEWDRTRKMGVNTLAFRGAQHGAFYAVDPDCVGLTTKIPWNKNKQWMELVAKSGTTLFISAQPEATGTEQKTFIKECFRLASQNQPLGEPLDWMENPVPQKWKLNGEIITFNWD
jgi:alpha-galactosidase